MNVESSRSSGNFKKSSLSNDEAIYRAACRAQSNDGQAYIEIDKLDGRPVKVLRDTGCTGMIVDRALIPDSMVIPGSSGSLQMVEPTLIDVLLANIYLEPLYYNGHCKVMCVSSPVYPVIIGNVRGARQMLPDPHLKAEDREELDLRPVWATTMTMTTKVVICPAGCSKRSLTEEKQRRETRRSPSRSNRMIAMLHKMSKSKEAPWKESALLDRF